MTGRHQWSCSSTGSGVGGRLSTDPFAIRNGSSLSAMLAAETTSTERRLLIWTV